MQWTNGDYINSSVIIENQTIGLDKNSRDTDSPSDWENPTNGQADPFGIHSSSVTSGARNLDATSSLVINEILYDLPGSDYDFDWNYRKKITINSSEVAGDLTDFPVLINITDPDLVSKAQTDGDDILFTSSNGEIKFDHQIESYNSGNGQLYAWVKIPFLSSTVDTEIYMYYNNSAAENQENVESVWSNNYKGIWHLNETSGDALDSTSYSTDGTLTGTVTQGDPGKIDSAYTFDSTTTSNVNMGDPVDGHLDFGNGSFTLSLWVRDSPETHYQHILYKGAVSVGDPAGYSFYHRNNDGEACWSVGDTVDRVQNDFDYTQDGTWRYLVGVVDRSNQSSHVYLNGIEQGTGTDISSVGSVDNARDFQLSEASNEVNGRIDEVRISIGVRSTAWIATEFNNQNDTGAFLYSGSEEAISATSDYEWVELYNPSTTAVDLTDWEITDNDGNSFDLSGAGSIPAGGYLVCHLATSGTNSSTDVYGPIINSGGSPQSMLGSPDDLIIMILL
jgi:hypothetical protein